MSKNFFKFKQINIVALSSYPTQLGFVITQRFHSEKNKNSKNKDKILYIFFIYPTRTDLDIVNRANIEGFLKNNPVNENIEIQILLIKNNCRRLLAYLYILLIRIIKRKKNITLWQPRYLFLEDTFSFKNNLFRLPLKEFNTILFGDGFLNFMPINKPFWLSKNNDIENNLTINKKNLIASYHSFNLQDNRRCDITSNKISNIYLLKCIEEYIEYEFDLKLTKSLNLIRKKLITFNKEYLRIYIFPLTTFYETGRTSLKKEIDLYLEFLRKSSLKNYDLLILKSHPGNEKEKISLFTRQLKNDDNFKCINIISNKIFEDSFPLERIPLEIIVSYLNILNNKKEIKLDICLTCSSTATLSTKLIIKNCKIEFAFGEKLINKYLYKEFSKKRLEQENYIHDQIKNI